MRPEHGGVPWRTVAVTLGLLWLLGFGVYFFTRMTPNPFDPREEIRRSDLLLVSHWILLESIDPGDPPATQARSGWRYFPQRLDLLVVAVAILSAAWSLGHLALRALGVRPQQRTAGRTVFAFALGLSGWSLITLLLGLAGLLVRPLFVPLMLLCVGAEFWRRWRVDRTTDAAQGARSGPWWRRRFLTGSLLPPVVVAAAAPFVLAMLLGAMLPSIDFDVKEYHLQGPKEFYQNGRITFLPHNVYTSFPFLTEMLTLLAMVLRGDWFRGALAGKVVLMSFAPLTALGLYAAGRFVRPSVGWLAALVYLATPWVYRISVIAYVEGGLAFYLMATLLAVLCGARKALPSGSPLNGETIARGQPMTWANPLLCGLLAGSALACKYPGLVSVVVPAGLAVIMLALRGRRGTAGRERFRLTGKAALLFALGVLITFGPWALKNWWQTGNPVYPLLYAVFGGADWSDALNEKWRSGHALPGDVLTDPAAMLPDLKAKLLDVAARSDWQSALMFGLAPLSLLTCLGPTQPAAAQSETAETRRLVRLLWAYAAWLFLTWWGLTHRIDRFWVPMLPVIALLAGIGAGALWERLSVLSTVLRFPPAALLARSAVVMLIGVALLFNLAFITTPKAGYNAYLLDLDAASLDASTPSIRLLNEHLPPRARVLLVGEAQVFDARFDHVYNTVFDRSIFEDWFAADAQPDEEGPLLRPAAEIRETLAEAGITHVFVNWAEILRYREPGSYGYTEFASPRTFRRLVQAELLQPVALRPEESLMLVDALSDARKRELHEWAPELERTYLGEPVFVAYELFEVPPESRR